jgi:hypothetical protein
VKIIKAKTGVIVFNATFNNVAVSFIGGGNRRKPQTNFIT